MAKWGEGDPRWIVEERPDAVNVNNWHWTEKNATPWSKERLRSLFNGFAIKSDGGSQIECKIASVTTVDGEATANNRKGKLIFFYEWNVVLKWTGAVEAGAKSFGGDVTIPNLSEENDLDEIQITIGLEESTDESEKLRKFMYNVGREQLRKQIGVYLKELREEFSKGLILPTKDSAAKPVKPDGVSNITSGFNKQVTVSSAGSKSATTTTTTAAAAAAAAASTTKATGGKPLGVPIGVKTITAEETFQCQAHDLYEVLTDQQRVSAFTSGASKCEAHAGGKFELFGGNINGKFVELVADKKIVQSWRVNQWPEGHYSTVTLELVEMSDHTKLKMTQTGVPEREVEATQRNWKLYYWNSIKQTFGFGSYI